MESEDDQERSLGDDDTDKDGNLRGFVASDPEELLQEQQDLAAHPEAVQYMEGLRVASCGQAERQRARFNTYLEGLYVVDVLGMKLEHTVCEGRESRRAVLAYKLFARVVCIQGYVCIPFPMEPYIIALSHFSLTLLTHSLPLQDRYAVHKDTQWHFESRLTLFSQTTFSSHWVTRTLETGLKHCLESRPGIALGGAPSGLSSEDGEEDGSPSVSRRSPHPGSSPRGTPRSGGRAGRWKKGQPHLRSHLKVPIKARGYGEKVSDSSDPDSSDEDFIVPDDDVEAVRLKGGSSRLRQRDGSEDVTGPSNAAGNRRLLGRHPAFKSVDEAPGQGLKLSSKRLQVMGEGHSLRSQQSPIRGGSKSKASVGRLRHVGGGKKIKRTGNAPVEDVAISDEDLPRDSEDDDEGETILGLKRQRVSSQAKARHRRFRCIEDENEDVSPRLAVKGSGDGARSGLVQGHGGLRRAPGNAGRPEGSHKRRGSDGDEGKDDGYVLHQSNGEWEFISDGEGRRRHLVHYGYEWHNKCGLCNRKRSATHYLRR